MVSQIIKLKKFGIFQDFKPTTELKDFNKFNLIYGWNGSGKSTLAKLFFSIQNRVAHEHFDNAEFSIIVKDIPEINNKNISENTLNIKVFNKDFIEKNVNFEQSKANSIILLSEEKKEEMDKYKLTLAKLTNQRNKQKTDKIAYNKAVEDLKKDLSKWASSVKKSFELIETTNTYFLNYDRTKIAKFIKDKKVEIKQQSILTQESVKDLKNSIKPTKKDDLQLDVFLLFDTDVVNDIFTKLTNVLTKSIFSNQIKRLTENPLINQWVQTGISIHHEHKSENCEFCGQIIPKERIIELNHHFSKDYEELTQSLNDIGDALLALKTSAQMELPEVIGLYDEFHSQFQLLKNTYEDKKQIFINLIDEALVHLSKKVKNPFLTIEYTTKDIEQKKSDFNLEIKQIIELLLKHNNKNLKFEEEVKKSQDKLELHFVSDVLITEKYNDTEKSIQDQKEILDQLDLDILALDATVNELESILINEAVGADSFNKSLEKFIGRKDISIEFDKELKGYKLIRSGKSEPATNLSEGEKTAIAFVYFISKLKENGNIIEESIIVVDDPISSFDSNHLFHSYSYLKQECEKSKQLIVLTHNFQYFKLVRDWMINKNKKEWKAGELKETIKSHFYSIDCTISENRTSTINNANKTLLDFNSEYHYIFHKLHSFKDVTPLDLEKAFLIANLSRKLLEGFLTFKFPKGRNDFNQLMQAGCKDNELREKVYRFINKYSHNQQIEFHDAPVDNLLGEGDNIISNVFNIINELDKSHHDEMIEVCDANVS